MICILFSAAIPEVGAFDPSQRSWVSVEIQTFAVDNILIKLSAVTAGNNLNRSIQILEPPIGSGIVVGRGAIQAEYSADSNTTTFTYILPPLPVQYPKSGSFSERQMGHHNLSSDRF